MKIENALRLLVASTLLLAAGVSHAQYVWIGDKGIKHYSDRPPPPSVPASKILQAPGLQQLDTAAPAEEAATPTAKAAPTLADRETDYRKKAAERAERDKKAGEEAQRTTAQRDNCAAAREYKQSLESGARVGVTSETGERGYMDDAERARRIAKASKIIEGCN